jgi:trehalose 6-phosphate phosphatase
VLTRPWFDSFLLHPEESILLLDYDGTIAPIVPEPDDAYPVPDTATALNRLSDRLGCVAIVSGRSVSFLLDRLQDCPGIVLAGNYGVERVVDGQVLVDTRVQPHIVSIHEAARRARELLPGLLVELKSGLSVTVHWRKNPESETSAVRVAQELARTLGLEAHPARMAVELRPPILIDKGSVVADLCKGYRHAAYAGDDQGDLPAFRALRQLREEGSLASALLIAVTSLEAPPELAGSADLTLGAPAILTGLLGNLADELEAAGRRERSGRDV